jgi:hypothetical protein
MGYVIAEQSGMVLSPLRVLVFSAVVFGAWYHFKLSLHGLGLWESRKDVAIVIPVAIGLVGTMMGRFRGHDAHPLLLGSAAVIAVATFASFNPLQRAWPIFNRPQTERLRNLDITAELAPDNRLVVGGYEGALLNGLGYRSASHVLPTPQVEYFHRMMPELSEARVNEVFNRYAHITLTNSLEPHVIGPDAVAVPVRIFQTPRERDRWIVFSPSTHAPPPQSPPAIGEREAGFVDEVRLEDHALTIRGWAPWVGLTGRQGLKIYLSHPAMEASLESEPRPDVMAANPGQGFSHNGFVARLTLPPELPLPPPEALRVCVVAVDQDTGDAMHLRFSGDAAAAPGPGVECPPSAPLQTATQAP